MFNRSLFSYRFFRAAASMPKAPATFVKFLSVAMLMMMAVFIVNPAAADGEALILPVGQAMQQSVGTSALSHAYKFTAVNNRSIFILAVSKDYRYAPSITITRDATDEQVASVKEAVSGMCLRIAPGTDNYTMNVSANFSNTAMQQPNQFYGVMLMPGASTQMECPNNAMTALSNFVANGTGLDTALTDANTGNSMIIISPGLNTSGSDCQASPDSAIGVNVRGLDNLSAPILSNIPANTSVPVVGTVSNGDWVLVNSNGVVGFASGNVISVGGNCANVPVISVDGNQVTPTGDATNLGALTGVTNGLGGVGNLADTVTGVTNGLGGVGNLADTVTGATNVLGNGLSVDANEGGTNSNGNVTLNNNGLQINGDTPAGNVNTNTNNQGQTCVNVLGINVSC